jgi:uncharacterized protein YcfJ
MQHFFKKMLSVAAMSAAAHASAQVTIFENNDFQGRSYSTQQPVNNFARNGFNDRASSIIVKGETWEVCEAIRFRGHCMVLRPGRYPSLGMMNLNDRISSMRPLARGVRIEDSRYAPMPVVPQVVFYENENFTGRSFTADQAIEDFNRFGFNDRASSAVVFGDRWEACTHVRFGGQCVVLRPGRYASLVTMGMNDSVSSVRALEWSARVEEPRLAPAPVAVYDNRLRNEERLFEVNVDSVRAVMAVAGQRCWMEPAQVPQTRANPNVGGAIAGALIGGILGHQVGGGVGKDLATVGGAVAGAAIGSKVGRDGGTSQPGTQDVQRCVDEPGLARPAYWDVSYRFRDQDHHVQMTYAPGATITVNARGEPRS